MSVRIRLTRDLCLNLCFMGARGSQSYDFFLRKERRKTVEHKFTTGHSSEQQHNQFYADRRFATL